MKFSKMILEKRNKWVNKISDVLCFTILVVSEIKNIRVLYMSTVVF